MNALEVSPQNFLQRKALSAQSFCAATKKTTFLQKNLVYSFCSRAKKQVFILLPLILS